MLKIGRFRKKLVYLNIGPLEKSKCNFQSATKKLMFFFQKRSVGVPVVRLIVCTNFFFRFSSPGYFSLIEKEKSYPRNNRNLYIFTLA